jgi:hypothetical protein
MRSSQKEYLRTSRHVILPVRLANDALDELANRSALLRPEENRRESLLSCRSLSGQDQKVHIVGQHHTLIGQRFVKQIGIVSLLAPVVLNTDNVHPTLTQCLDQAKHNLFVRVPFQHRSAFSRANVTGQLRMVVQKLLDDLRFLLHRLIDLVAVILVVRQRRVHLCERQPRVYASGDLFRRQAAQVASRNDISNSDAMPVDAWLSSDNARCTNDVRIFGLG